MRFATFRGTSGPDHLGLVLTNGWILDLTAALPDDDTFASMLGFIQGGPAAQKEARQQLERVQSADVDPTHFALPLADVELRAPIPRPHKNVFCVGMNYRSHVEANARALGVRAEVGDTPLFFSKPPTAVIGPGRPILLDERVTRELDWEVELAVVVGRGGTWIPEEEALDHVFGYTLLNDVSARDLQRRTSQMFIGKGLDSYCPIGPWIVDRDEGADGAGFELVCRVNGIEYQRDSTAFLIFPIARIIAELSRGLTLEAGDIIATGTPGGCGYQLTPPRFLAVGDLVECSAIGIGTLANPVASWTPSGASATMIRERTP
jgi:2-keto-4-pentenoate hydratase/2-oxohepta-3-ene-1,7-dioic acid hydratase in catechol pathway